MGKYKIKKYRKKKRMTKADMAYRMASKALRSMNVEYKTNDYYLNAGITSDTLTITQLTNIQQGTTNKTREGNQIKVVRITISGLVVLSYTNVDYDYVRFMLVYDKQTNGAIYTAADLLATEAPEGLRNLDNVRRFHVLKDIRLELHNNHSYFKHFKFSVECNHKIRYDANAGTINDLTEGSFSLARIGLQSMHYSIAYVDTRVRFVDN